jgi:hypothetical protein
MNRDLTQTRRQILPYHFQLLLNGKVAIKKTNGQSPLIVARGQVESMLQRDDLDPHRRKMYEAALEVWTSQEKTQ